MLYCGNSSANDGPVAMLRSDIPLTLYIHIPWCVRKCPYCDFNSHAAKGELPEQAYVAELLRDIDAYLPLLGGRKLSSIFFGGGTPSLFSADAISNILDGAKSKIGFEPGVEITLEANPGTIDQKYFHDYRSAGINRLSLGIQSLQNEKLKILGRIHDSQQAIEAIQVAKAAGFENFNLDIMYGLPEQTIEEAMHDIETALALEPKHFSWYQLTIEPNTVFYRYPPTLPKDEYIWEMQLAGQQLLKSKGYDQYEVSAYAKPEKQCKHNRNYWEFGDYLGIGAGAHSKITTQESIYRFAQVRMPKDYLARNQVKPPQPVANKDLTFEFMLNALRLNQGVPAAYFQQRTGIDIKEIQNLLANARSDKLLIQDIEKLCATEHGARYLNNLIMRFLT